MPPHDQSNIGYKTQWSGSISVILVVVTISLTKVTVTTTVLNGQPTSTT